MLRIVEVKDEVLTDVVIGGRTRSSRSDNGRRVTCGRASCVVAGVGADVHDVCDIDPDEPVNMSLLLAFEFTQA